MAEQTTVAESSPAEVVDPFQGQQPTMEEYSRYRADGEVPERFKPAGESESAPDDAQEETEEGEEPDTEDPEPEPEEAQEKPQKGGAEKRIKQLLAKQKELEAQLAARTDVKPESSTVPQPQQPKHFFPKPTPEDKNPDGTAKFETYEDVVEAIGRWAAKEERMQGEIEQQQKEALRAVQSKLDEARSRYEDADEVIAPVVQAMETAVMPQLVKDIFGNSPLLADLCYVIGSDPAELKKFINLAQTDPRAAIGKVYEYERGIREELSQSQTRDSEGKFTSPVKKPTSAPKPPSPVGGSSSRAFDVSDESLSPDAWFAKRNEQLARK